MKLDFIGVDPRRHKPGKAQQRVIKTSECYSGTYTTRRCLLGAHSRQRDSSRSHPSERRTIAVKTKTQNKEAEPMRCEENTVSDLKLQ
jgi:hypothetical protein